jgi:hypothetical protein
MSKHQDTVERLVQQTVRSVLFNPPSGPGAREKQQVAIALADSSLTNALKKITITDVRQDSVLYLLTSGGNNCSEDPAEDEDNSVGEAYRGSWVVECASWSVDRLRAEKAAVKRYLGAQRRELASESLKAPNKTSDATIAYEAYALLKLFLLERDPDYRQCLEQSIGCTSSFLTSLRALLTLYATYFERAHGRKVGLQSTS